MCHLDLAEQDLDMTANIQVMVYWVVTPCIVVVGYRCLRGPYCLHLHNPEDLNLKGLSTLIEKWHLIFCNFCEVSE
jgi:hypothetical protein